MKPNTYTAELEEGRRRKQGPKQITISTSALFTIKGPQGGFDCID